MGVFEAVDTVESMWSLEDTKDRTGRKYKTLFINLVKPEPSDDEVTWKKGR